MIGHVAIEPEPAEPTIGEVQMDLVAEPPLRADTKAVADDQHAQKQLRIDRGTARAAVERCQLSPQVRQVDEAVDRAKKMVRRHMPIE